MLPVKGAGGCARTAVLGLQQAGGQGLQALTRHCTEQGSSESRADSVVGAERTFLQGIKWLIEPLEKVSKHN